MTQKQARALVNDMSDKQLAEAASKQASLISSIIKDPEVQAKAEGKSADEVREARENALMATRGDDKQQKGGEDEEEEEEEEPDWDEEDSDEDWDESVSEGKTEQTTRLTQVSQPDTTRSCPPNTGRRL